MFLYKKNRFLLETVNNGIKKLHYQFLIFVDQMVTKLMKQNKILHNLRIQVMRIII